MSRWNQREILETERLLIAHLEHNPRDIDCLIKLCLTELAPPMYDFFSALGYLERVHDIDPCNHTAIILEAGIKYYNMSIDEITLHRLRLVNSESDEEKAIILYLMSLYYADNSRIEEARQKERSLLETSIAQYGEYPYPHKMMGHILLSESRPDEALLHFRRAMDCVAHVFVPEDSYDYTDPQMFINEFITGRFMTDTNYESLMAQYEAAKKLVKGNASH